MPGCVPGSVGQNNPCPLPVAADVLLLGPGAEGDLASFDTVLAPAGYRVRACATIQQAIRLLARIDPCAGLLRLGSRHEPPIANDWQHMEPN